MGRWRLKQAVLGLVLLLARAAPAVAQTTTGVIAGLVRDESGGVMPGVLVTVRETSTGLERSAATAENGTFRIAALPFGRYDLRAEISGFSTVTVPGIELAVDQVRTVSVVMPVGQAQETVTVTAAPGTIITQSPKIAQVIDNSKVLGLPLNGRNFAQLALLSPGVSASGGGGGQQGGEGGVSGFSSNGQRSSSNNFLVDGVDNNNYLAGAVAQLPSIDSIQEFEVQTNTFAAEYGRNSGSVVNLITRSGANRYQGALYEFLRDDALDARNFFDNPNQPKPELNLHQFGGTMGGPLRRDRAFFFASYEGFRRRAGITRLTNVPTLEQRQGIFRDPSGNPVQVNVHPVSAQLFQLFPLPNVSGPSGNFVSSPELSHDTDQVLVKMDWRLRESDNFLVRYTQGRADQFFPFAPGQGGTTIPSFGVISDGSNQLLAANYTRILTSRALNEFRFGFNHTRLDNIGEAGPRAADFGFNTGHDPDAPRNLGNIPNITFSGGLVSGGGRISNLGGTINNPSGANQQTFQFIDHFSFNTPRHAWKFGVDIRHIQLDRRFDLAFSGQIIFNGANNSLGVPDPLIDFAEGRASGSLQFVGDSLRELRTTSYSFFAQDSFRVSDRLVLNYGLRYDLNTVLRDTEGRLSTFRPDRFQQFLSPAADQTDLETLRRSGVVTQDEVEGLYRGDHNNFAPRIGLSYSLDQDSRTVLRAAYGIYYDTILGNIPGNVMLNPPFLPGYFIPHPSPSFRTPSGPRPFPSSP